MKVLVTGATGLVGNNLVRYLIEQGHDCTAVVRPPSTRKELEQLDINVIATDLTDPAAAISASADHDAIVHAAATSIWVGRKSRSRSNLMSISTAAFAKAAKHHQIRMIQVSSVDALAACIQRVARRRNPGQPAQTGMRLRHLQTRFR